MATPRFFAPELSVETVTLSGREARHALAARRLSIGDEVELFDGRGGVARGRIASCSRDRLAVVIVERQTIAPHAWTLMVAASTPKGPRADWMIEKLAELGCGMFIPLVTARGVVRPSDAKLDRWRRKCVEAAKQCGAAVPMEIGQPASVEELLGPFVNRGGVFAADPQPQWPAFAECLAARVERAAVLVGPEGGWTDEERERLQANGARLVRLVATTLRVETAAVAMAAAWALRAAHR